MSLVADLQVLIDVAIRADESLMNITTDIHSQIAPEGSPLPYIVIGTSTENDDFRSFGNFGYNGTEQVTYYSEYEDKLQAAEAYKHMERIFNRKTFGVGDFAVRTRCTLLTLDQDVGGKSRAVAIVRALSRREA